MTDRDDTSQGEGALPGAGRMTVLEHIAELRNTLLWALGLAAVAAIASWAFSPTIIEILFRPVNEAGEDLLYFSAPLDAFLLRLKTSAVVGLLLVLPLILYKVYSFVMPGLLPKEKRVVTPLLVAATALFYVGVGFCFLVLLPLVIEFALSFATDTLQPLLTASAYFDMAARLCLAFGLLFELPMVVFALSWVGIVDPKVLLKGWRYAFVLILIASAVLTPPDIISQVLLAGPVMVLYIASVLISMLVRRRQRREREEREKADREEEIAYRRAQARERAEERRRKASEDDDPDEPTDGPAQDPGPAPQPRPAPGATPRIDEAPDPDRDATDPPWVRRDRPADSGTDDGGGDGTDDDDPEPTDDDRESN